MAVAKGKQRVTVTLEGDLYRTLIALAEKESRSLSGQIRYELKKSIKIYPTGANGGKR